MTDRQEHSVVVIGAGIGGLTAAVDLASRGLDVLLLERAAAVGGKVRQLSSGAGPIDGGPTVFTMPWVFDGLFEQAGANFRSAVKLARADCIARHFWQDGSQLDLHADLDASAEAIGSFASSAEGDRFRAFMTRAGAVYGALKGPFLESSKPNPVSLGLRIGTRQALAIQPFHKLMSVLEESFLDPRLRQLFGRYATYCGASPYLATATLMLVAYVEQEGVYALEGGMFSLATALERLARQLGVAIRCEAEVATVHPEPGGGFAVAMASGERVTARTVVANVDAGGIAAGVLGPAPARVVRPVPARSRSLSAMTWTFAGRASGPALDHHNVCFSTDYRREFDALTARRMPDDPTVYVCAQDRSCASAADAAITDTERFFCLINAPANGDSQAYPMGDTERCKSYALTTLERCGVTLTPSEEPRATSPAGFSRLFPGSGGAIYGRASHGWMSTFLRAGNRSRLPGFYLAGGSVHPGPGVPMAALSGRQAASALWRDWTSRSRSSATAMPGGI